MTTFTFSHASGDDLIGVRCVGYEEPIVMFPSSKILGFARKDEPFDVQISPSRGIGWFEGGLVQIDEEHPATLMMDPATYRLEVTRILGGQRTTEWLVLDRIAGTMTLYAQLQGSPTETLKRGGTCSKLEPKF
jgi:hypothetical protein